MERCPSPVTVDAGATPGARRVELADGRTLVIRDARRSDVAALDHLYASLSPRDRRLRFFTDYRPSREFLETMVGWGDHGGCVLVAVVVAADGSTELVGDVWCSAPRGGEAELAIAVDASWRGWLGHLLVDALVEAAAARGIRDLVAVVLPENRPMLQLVADRPRAVLDDGDPTTVEVAIGATDAVPGWRAPHRRRRILVESATGRWPGAADATDAGWEVRVCPGPLPGGTDRCPARRGEVCPLVAGADVVVLPPGATPWEGDLCAAHRALHPWVPIVHTQRFAPVVDALDRGLAEGSTSPP